MRDIWAAVRSFGMLNLNGMGGRTGDVEGVQCSGHAMRVSGVLRLDEVSWGSALSVFLHKRKLLHKRKRCGAVCIKARFVFWGARPLLGICVCFERNLAIIFDIFVHGCHR